MAKGFCVIILAFLAAFTQFVQSARAEWLIRERIVNIDYKNQGPDASRPSIVDIDHSAVPELDVSYFIEKPFAVEVSGTASRQSASSALTSANLGDVWLIPITATAQYHFFADQPLQFYVGAGVNYSWFITSGNANSHSTKYDDSFGPVFQVGSDLQLTKNWSLNADVKKIYLRPKVSIDGSPKQEDRLDPWVIGGGVGYKF